jgi:hypothetical protein
MWKKKRSSKRMDKQKEDRSGNDKDHKSKILTVMFLRVNEERKPKHIALKHILKFENVT